VPNERCAKLGTRNNLSRSVFHTICDEAPDRYPWPLGSKIQFHQSYKVAVIHDETTLSRCDMSNQIRKVYLGYTKIGLSTASQIIFNESGSKKSRETLFIT
jgi:hypothetical protein